MRILVTGANGQVGRSILGLDGQDGHEIIGLTRQQFDLKKPEEFDRIVDQVEPDAIVNAAAYTMVDRAEDEPELAHQINAVAPRAMASVAAKSGLPFIQISTDYVFDGEKGELYKETDPTNPLNVYGQTKLTGELLVLEANSEALILRTSGVFSPFGHNFLRTIRKALIQRKELHVVDDQFVCPSYARSIAEVSIQLLSMNLQSNLFHYSGSTSVSWFDFAMLVREAISLDDECAIYRCKSIEYSAKAQRPSDSRLDNHKVNKYIRVKQQELALQINTCLKDIELFENEMAADTEQEKN